MKIKKEQVQTLAKLARLDFTGDQADAFVEQLPRIVEYVAKLQEVTTETPPPDRDQVPSLRIDEARPSKVGEEILSQAPERQDRFWKVPPVF